MLQELQWSAELLSDTVISRSGIDEEVLTFLRTYEIKFYSKEINLGRGHTVYARIKFNGRSHWFSATNYDLNTAITKAGKWAKSFIDVNPLARILRLPPYHNT